MSEKNYSNFEVRLSENEIRLAYMGLNINIIIRKFNILRYESNSIHMLIIFLVNEITIWLRLSKLVLVNTQVYVSPLFFLFFFILFFYYALQF